ncbi:hypothetical protein NMG60_11016595 [Bertholletia excelsa]
MLSEDICNTSLSLGSSPNSINNHLQSHHQKKSISLRSDQDRSFPTLTLALSSLEEKHPQAAPKIGVGKVHAESSGSPSTVSSRSNSSVKRERDLSWEEVEVEKLVSSKVKDDHDEEGSARKKLRLTKEQSIVLEESFKEHSTLNPRQKQALAEQLNLRPRQVEVWFQNRRARTKLKQTEVECELLKKCCETLTDENRRLQKELQELKALPVAAPPLYMQLPAATLTMCPSCEKICGSGGGESSSKVSFTVGANKPHFYRPLKHSSSAAC